MGKKEVVQHLPEFLLKGDPPINFVDFCDQFIGEVVTDLIAICKARGVELTDETANAVRKTLKATMSASI